MSVRYTKAPLLNISYNCGGFSCGLDTVGHDGDSFVCSDCQTSWTAEDDGQLYEDWNGDEDRDDVGEPVDPYEWPHHE